MKKLVTVSVVALAGATIGVGSTFGWWAEEIKPQPDPSAQVPQESKGEVIAPTEASNDSSGVQFEIIGDLQSKQPKTVTITLHPDNSEKIEQLAKEIEQEALQLEKQGEKQAAEKRRDLAQAIRNRSKELAQRATWFTLATPPDAAPTLGAKTSESRLNAGGKSKTETLAKDLEDQIDIIGDLQVEQPKKAGLQLDAAGREQIEQLAKELEQNAKELEDRNDKGRAEDQRRLASMVRGVLAGRNFEIHYRREKIDPQRAKNATELVAAVRKYSHWSVMTGQEKGLTRLLEAIATTEDADARKKLITKAYALGAFGQTIKSRVEADLPEWERLKLPIGASVPRNLKEKQNFRTSHLLMIDAHEGQISQLQAMLEKADRPAAKEKLQTAIRKLKEELQNLQRDAKLEQHPKIEEGKPKSKGSPTESPKFANPGVKQELKEKAPDGKFSEFDLSLQLRAKRGLRGPEGHHPPMDHQPGEIHGLLRALHHEIAELRGEVRDLRNLLSHERHPPLGELKHKGQDLGQGKAKHPDRDNDATGKGKVKNRDDDDDNPHLMRNYPPDYRPQGKVKNRDDDDDKGRIKNRDSDDTVGKGKAKSRDDDDDDKGKAKIRDDDDAVEKGKAQDRDDDRESDDGKAKGEQDD